MTTPTTETREQFRERITRVLVEAENKNLRKAINADDDPHMRFLALIAGGTKQAMAEAVYTQAVRDMYDFFRRTPPHLHVLTIQIFAEKRGIDLTEPQP